jgi:hypothetical protein
MQQMKIDAAVYRWHSTGMTQNPFASGETYVTVREVECMLETAHRRGFELGQQQPTADTARAVLRAEGFNV